MVSEFNLCTQATGLSIVMDSAQDAKMVDNLIGLRHRAVDLVDSCFSKDADFHGAINSAYEFFINKRENKPAEMMGASTRTRSFRPDHPSADPLD